MHFEVMEDEGLICNSSHGAEVGYLHNGRRRIAKAVLKTVISMKIHSDRYECPSAVSPNITDDLIFLCPKRSNQHRAGIICIKAKNSRFIARNYVQVHCETWTFQRAEQCGCQHLITMRRMCTGTNKLLADPRAPMQKRWSNRRLERQPAFRNVKVKGYEISN